MAIGLLAVALGSRPAVAAWSPPADCEFQRRHCYALTEWKPRSSEGILTAGSYIVTTKMYVPDPSKGFIDNEQWTGWRKRWWIEAGQAAGFPRTSQTQVYPFYAFNLKANREREEYEEFTSLSKVHRNRRNLYRFFGNPPPRPGREWCITEPWSSSGETKTSCFKSLYGPAEELETGVEAATDVEPLNEGFAQGFAVGGLRGLWQSIRKPERHATLWTTPGAKTCASERSPGYGSLSFGAGPACPLPAVPNPASSLQAEALDTPAPAGATQHPSVAAIEELAQREAALDQDEHPTSMTVWEGSLGATMEAMRPGSVRAPSSGPASAFLSEPVYLVELRGAFTLHAAKLPPNAPDPHGTVLRLVYDANAGELEGRSLGSTPLAPGHSLRATRPAG